MPSSVPQFSIILAAGKGTRMRSSNLHKVCFPIDGKPAIVRAIETYNECGIAHHVVVVGVLVGQVVESVGSVFDNTIFAYQTTQSGTANAARVGLQALSAFPGDADILLVAGDRLIESTVLEQLFDLFYSNSCDLALLARPRKDGSRQGRIVEQSPGKPLAIVEMTDILQRSIYRRIRSIIEEGRDIESSEILNLMKTGFFCTKEEVSEEKMAKAFGKLWQKVSNPSANLGREDILQSIPEEMTYFEWTTPEGEQLRMTPEEVEQAGRVNSSVYLIKASALRFALEHLAPSENAQQEEYLSDLISILNSEMHPHGRGFLTRTLLVENPAYLMGFNDPAELLQVEEYFQNRKRPRTVDQVPDSKWYKPIDSWLKDLDALLAAQSGETSGLMDEFKAIYGNDPEVIKERAKSYRETLEYAAKVLPPQAQVLIVRSPGRVNVLSRHIDHQGGNCNLMTIGYETLMVIHARSDDQVHLRNVDQERFPSRQFSIGQLVMDLPWDDWLSLINSEKVSRMIQTTGGDWSQYIMAAVLRLQKKFNRTKLLGMDMVVSGNIPMAAGLSSSSSLVVGAAEATIALNQLDTFPAQFVDLCGEGEWFVGTRGGSADHAALKIGQKGKVLKVRFFDFAVEDLVPFPAEYIMAVCDSGLKAHKSANTRQQFNHRITCYRIGFHLIKKFFPQFAPLLHHLRDVNVRNLRIPLSWIYKFLLHLPENASRQELLELDNSPEMRSFLGSQESLPDALYPIRGVVLFGLAECERARLYADFLRSGKIREIGQMMNVSHNGDRVVHYTEGGEEVPYTAPVSNSYLLGLMEDLESGDPGRVLRAQLQWQPGSYSCSLPRIDRMVDISTRTPGVLGAQLAGAGLGGCMMVLAEKDSLPALMLNLKQQYYEPEGLPHTVLPCKPIAGSGILMKRN
jgi:N-acetylgalactosamine kinase